MSGLPPGGYTPHPPPPANEGKLANYFGGSDSSNNPFAFATKGTDSGMDPFQQSNMPSVSAPFSQLQSGQAPIFMNAPPSNLPHQPEGIAPDNNQHPHQQLVGMPLPSHHPNSQMQQDGRDQVEGYPPVHMYPTGGPQPPLIPGDSFVPQTGQPPPRTNRIDDSFIPPQSFAGNHLSQHSHLENSHTFLCPPSMSHCQGQHTAATLPFTGQQVTNQSDSQVLLPNQQLLPEGVSQSQAGQPLNLFDPQGSSLVSESGNGPDSSKIDIPHHGNNSVPPQVPPSQNLGINDNTNPVESPSSVVHSTAKPAPFTPSEHPILPSTVDPPVGEAANDHLCVLDTEKLSDPTTAAKLSPQGDTPLAMSSYSAQVVQMDKGSEGEKPEEESIEDSKYLQKEDEAVSVDQSSLTSSKPEFTNYCEPGQDRGFPSSVQTTSLTGSNVSTGANTPLPPVAAPPLYQSHSVPNNLHGVAEKLTNAHYIPRQSLTNAQLYSEGTEHNTLPSSTSAGEFERYSSNYTSLPMKFHQTSGFVIGPIDDADEESILPNMGNEQREDHAEAPAVKVKEERAVIGCDSNPSSAYQFIPSTNEREGNNGPVLGMQVDGVQTVAGLNVSPPSPTNSEPQVDSSSTLVSNSQTPNFVDSSTATVSDAAINTAPFVSQAESSHINTFPPPQTAAFVAPSSASMPIPSSDIMTPFIPPFTVGINTTRNLGTKETVSHPKPLPSPPKMEEEVENPESKGFIPQPEGQDQPHMMFLPPSLSVPPKVDLTLGTSVPMESSAPLQSLHSSSTSAFSLPQFSTVSHSIDPPPPPVVNPQTVVKRNSSLTNADTVDQNPIPPMSLGALPPVVTEQMKLISHDSSSNPAITNVAQVQSTAANEKSSNSMGSRSPLAGRERPEYDSHQRDRDHYRRDNREMYDSRYDRGRDDYYYNEHHRYYRPDDRPHSRTAYPYDSRDYDHMPEKSYYRRDYRDERRDHHYNSYYDDRDRYWRGQRQEDYYHNYDRYQYDHYQADRGYQSYRDHYYQDYHYPDDRRRHYEGYPPDHSHSRQHYYDNVVLPDESSIYGHHDSYVDSPGSQYQHGSYDHRESTRIEQPDYSVNEYGQDPYANEQNLPERYPVEGHRQDEEEPFRPIQATPPPPVRETPLPFAHPHVSIRFGIGGHLVTVSPVVPTQHTSATVEIHSLKDLIPQASQLSDRTAALPGPLLPGETSKNAVIRYVSQASDECTRISQDLELSPQSRDVASDDALLWRFLSLMCQQNGVLVPSDISELLMKESSLLTSRSPVRGVGVGGAKEAEKEEDLLNDFRQFLLSGRKKDALELACRRSLWGHALMLSSRMDDQSRTYVVNRFTASLPTTDPLNTFYTMMLGRVPSVVRPEGLGRAGDWRSHLAMMVVNNQDKSSISTLGDSLLMQGRVHAAHLCYHLSGLQIGSEAHSSYSLLGIKTPSSGGQVFVPEPEDLCRTEVFEYALGLSRADFTIASFQRHKLLQAIKLLESGLLEKALRYCESIVYYVTRDTRQYNPTFLTILQELSTRLHHASCPLGVMEMELPSWIIHLEQSMNDSSLGDNHTPPPSRDSPSLASAGRLVTDQQPLQYATQNNMFGDHLQVPQNPSARMPEQSSSQTSLSQNYTPVNAPSVEQEYGQQQYQNELYQQHQLTNEFSQQLTTANNYSTEQQMMGGVTYQMGGDSNIEQVSSTPANNDSEPRSDSTLNQNQTMTVIATTNQFVNSSWANFGHQHNSKDSNPYEGMQLTNKEYGNVFSQNEGHGNVLGSNPSPYSNQGGTEVSGVDYGRDYSSTNAQQQIQHDHPFTGFGIEGSNSAQQVPITAPSYLPSEHKQQDEVAPSTESEHVEDTGEDELEEKNEEKKKGSVDGKQQGQSGWLGGILNWIPKGSKRAHLPKDTDKRIVFDKEKNKWVNLDEDEVEDSAPTAPPTDNELKKQKPATSVTSDSNQTDGPPGSSGPSGSNMYSRNRLGGRLGARSMYVDVLNTGGTKQTHSTGSGPPPPSLMPPMMSSMAPMQMNPGTFFKSTGPSIDSSGETTHVSSSTENQSAPLSVQTEDMINSQFLPNPSSQTQSSSHPPTLQQYLQEEEPPQSARSSTSIEFEPESSKQEMPQPPPQPQFFNPSAFSSVNQMHRQQLPQVKKEPFPDNVSSRPNRPHYHQYPTASVTKKHSQYSNRPVGGQPRPPPGGQPRLPPGGNWL